MNCHCCNTTYAKTKLTFSCPSCKHQYKHKTDTVKYHTTKYRESNGSVKNGVIVPGFHEYREKICKCRIKIINKYLKGTAIDIGSGGGTFANSIKNKVTNVECLELDPILIAESRSLGFTTYDQDFLQQKFDKQYDLVFAWHVLEHVLDVEGFVSKCRDLCMKHVFIEVPVNRQIPKRFDGHVHYFSYTSFKMLMTKYFESVYTEDGCQMPSVLFIGTPK